MIDWCFGFVFGRCCGSGRHGDKATKWQLVIRKVMEFSVQFSFRDNRLRVFVAAYSSLCRVKRKAEEKSLRA